MCGYTGGWIGGGLMDGQMGVGSAGGSLDVVRACTWWGVEVLTS